MIIDKSAFENLDFALLEDNSDILEDNNEIILVIKKYNLMPNINYLINSTENNYLVLINYISHLYNLHKPLGSDIANILKLNIEFKEYLLSDIKRRLKNLTTNTHALLFEEIKNVINLLSLGKEYHIIENYMAYNFDEISNIFRDYESILKKNVNNIKLFNSTFQCYFTLIDTFMQLCLINSTDIQRKKTIKPIINILTETINILKFTVSLSENNINTLNNILGKLLYYFTHIPFYEVKTKTMDYIIEEFHLNLEKQADGYHLSKNTHFGNQPKEKQSEFIRLKNNSSLLILILIKKLEFHFKNIEFFSNNNFQKIIDFYNRNFVSLINKSHAETLNSFKTKLLDSLIYSYKCEDKYAKENLTHTQIIQNFVINGKNYNYNNLETIHNILLFSNDIKEYQYLNVADILLNSNIIENDYYEFFKLKTIDIIINKIIETKSQTNIESFIKTLLLYIEYNKTSSHFISSFSKIYLSLSLYYSNQSTNEELSKAKKFYSKFIKINGSDLLKKEYQQINSLILSNLETHNQKPDVNHRRTTHE